MTDNTSSYDLTAIHKLLTAAFGAEELRRFCRSHPLFQPVVANFGPNYNLNQMADEVIGYCRTHLLWDEFLMAIEEENPRQYDRFRDCLRISAPPAYVPPSPPIPSEPAAKEELLPANCRDRGQSCRKAALSAPAIGLGSSRV